MTNSSRARAVLDSLPADLPSVVTGFDGFVDEMITLVDQRESLDTFTPVRDIPKFAQLIAAAAGHNSLREIVVTATHPGGCAVNLGDGLAALGVPVDCFATLGEPIHPAFAATLARFRSAHSWGREPGRTLAFEFADGKLMFSAVRQLAELTADDAARRLADGTYADACQQAGIIALTDWSLYPHMTEVWALLQSTVYAELTHRPHFFIDLVDPASRTDADIRGMLEILPGFAPAGPLTLGLNANEANILARLRDLAPASNPDEFATLAPRLRESLDVATLVIHNARFALAADKSGTHSATPPFCENPAKSTGAGDRFNAGYCLGLLAQASPEDCLALACTVAATFVRTAASPTRENLLN